MIKKFNIIAPLFLSTTFLLAGPNEDLAKSIKQNDPRGVASALNAGAKVVEEIGGDDRDIVIMYGTCSNKEIRQLLITAAISELSDMESNEWEMIKIFKPFPYWDKGTDRAESVERETQEWIMAMRAKYTRLRNIIK